MSAEWLKRLLMIARREYVSYIKTAGFWISICVIPLVLGFFTLGGSNAIQSTVPPLRLAVVDLSGSDFAVALRPMFEGSATARIVAAPQAAVVATTPEAVGRALQPALAASADQPGGIDEAVVVSGSPTRLRLDLWSREGSDVSLTQMLQSAAVSRMHQASLRADGVSPALLDRLDSTSPDLRRYSARTQAQLGAQDQAPVVVALGLAVLLVMNLLTAGGFLLNGVIEEKSGRILEVLMTSVSIPQILGGKILGAAALTGTVLAIWAGLGLTLMLHSAPAEVRLFGSALLAHGLIVYFLLFFVFGYLMYASIFAAIGAFCETAREAQALMGPLIIFMGVPILFLSLAIGRPNAPLVAALSFAPPFTPFLMPARIAAGLPAWQAVLSLLLMAATALLVVWLCGRVFRAGALSGGGLDLRRLATGVLKAR